MHRPSDLFALHALLVSTDRDEFRKPQDRYTRWTILAPISGGFEFDLDAAELPERVVGQARFGDIVVCPPGGTLRRRLLETTTYVYVSLEQVGDLPPGRRSCTDLERLRSDYRWLVETDQDMTLAADTRAAWRTHVVGDLLALLIRESGRASSTDPLVDEIVQYIHDHALEPDLELAALASRFGLGPSQLSRRFRAARDATPRSLVRAVRLQHARDLLVTTDLTVAQVARRSGYPDQFHFSRVFSRETGTSPSAYRTTHLT